ncbi:MAG TPA: MMPL family transporter [Acidimicrobiia bacterium]|nr:MMPL family transporter [Acidimicrobiia bacterium]
MYRRRRRVVAAWVVFLVAAFAIGNAAGGVFRTQFKLPGSESQAAFDLLKRSGFGTRTGEQAQIVFDARPGVDDSAVRTAMERLFDRIPRDVSRTSVVSPYSQEGARQIAQGGHVAYAEVNLADRDSNALDNAADTIRDLADRVHVGGLHVALGGEMFQRATTNGTSEGIGLFAAMVILLIAFGSVLAMGLPIGTALFGVGSGIAIVLIVRTAIDMPNFTTAAVAMVGIGVGIDYALFLVTRYREGLHAGLDPEAAVVRSVDTSGRAVLFAGTTVLISILGLLFIGQSVIRGVAIAIAIGVAMTMVASVTLLPALLGFVGRNIDRLGLPHRRRAEATGHESVWYRWSRVLQHRPWPALVAGFAFLLVLAVPTVAMRLGFSDAGNRPTSDTTRQAYDLLSRGFGPGFNGPLLLAAETPGGASDTRLLQQVSAELNHTRGIAFATPPQANPGGSAAILQVFPTTAPQDEATANLVSRLRDDILPAATRGTDVDIKVGGVTAAADDYASYTESRLPVFIGAVLVLSFLLLMVVFRSLLVPLKAVVMNLLSIGAAYGIVVAVFQWGWGASLFGVGKEGPIEAWAPIMMFAIVFGLSMDYEVFLLSRIKEEYDRTHVNATAVADGLAVTARVITAAAAIMVCVFGSFVFGDEHALQVFGLGLAVAVLADATVVRLVLVPATMELLGDRNWWIPRWLDRILPRVHVEGADRLDEELAALDRESRTRV